MFKVLCFIWRYSVYLVVYYLFFLQFKSRRCFYNVCKCADCAIILERVFSFMFAVFFLYETVLFVLYCVLAVFFS